MTQNGSDNIDITNMGIEDIKKLTDKLIPTSNIKTLTSYPEIISVTAYWTGSSGQILVLWKNTGGSGWVKVEAGRDVTVTGLTNYITYSIDVRAITNSNKISMTGATESGSPRPACQTMGTPILTIPS